ncbi:hypothetical protein NQ314_004815 [Rhamnusium bicolor]|uniref:Uncharacterized protein n=1 Tax=Rhamnusium bicolor TaxID=1586634 RepID=A0AAV8ZIW5_9CUCU|nr:hypothetical protein NQ314_004815 [Rhamnusium bicolor]
MEADSPPVPPHSADVTHTEIVAANDKDSANKVLNDSCEEVEADSTIHGFNISNVTVIERELENLMIDSSAEVKKTVQCEGSDSGVEVIENVDICVYQRALSSNSGNSQDFDNLNGARSCDSSVISCCSNYEEAYNLLVRKNSTLLEDYNRNGDVTSENGSESSSISGSQPRSNRRTITNGTKKKVSVTDAKIKSSAVKDRSRAKPPVTPRNSAAPARLKSIDRLQGKSPQSTKTSGLRTKTTPNNLDLNSLTKKESKKPSSATTRNSSGTRTPSSTPTDDGRWPSINSKPAPLMSRSLKAQIEMSKPKITQMDTKTIEKYATLPRRRKEKSADSIKDQKKPSSRENSMHRLALMKKSSRETTPSKMTNSLYLPKNKQKIKIYHEICVQTALTMSDVEDALSGVMVPPKSPVDIEKCDRDVQVDMRARDIEKLQEQLKRVNEKYETLCNEHKIQTEKLKETEAKLKEERFEKDGLREELQNNSQRVMAILGGENNIDANTSSDSLMVLETRFQNVGQVVVQQEEEISKLNMICRSLQIDLEKSVAAQKALLLQQQELEAESIELQEFMQAEKTTLNEALKESEAELQNHQQIITQKDKELAEKQEECKHLVRLSEQRRQENLALQARLGVLENKSRELLVHQGSSVSGAAVALSALIGRLDGLVEELVVAYSISDQELDDVIFHNEAYNNSSSSPESTPEKSRKMFIDKSPSPQKGSSFVSAVINAIKNAAAQSPFAVRDISKDNLCTDRSSSNEMLDSETEPCLMMEHVLEDVIIPDGHSHNMISSGHGSMMSSRLTHSESLKDLSQAILNRQMSEQATLSFGGSLNTSFTSDLASLSDLFPSISLVDQVIDVDNLVTRLLKVIRIIQLENDDCMSELQEQRDSLSEQVDKQKETNKVVVKQLKDWEVLGARLKTEVKELMSQMSRKNTEMDNIKAELNKQREEVEKLNQDVCELSTALSKAELEMKIKEEEVGEEIKKWEKTGEMPTAEILGRLVVSQNEIPILKGKLAEKEKHLKELTQEFLASRQVLSESLKDAVNESKKQYNAIDNALEVLHSIQTVVQQCPPLMQLQRDLEEVNFQSASAMPIVAPSDCNANAALLQAVANLEITPTINTTA